MNDWNWFFSSFCQSAAALIGIIGAFIISRLLGLVEKVNTTMSTFDNLVIEFNRINYSLSKRYFYWYTKKRVEDNDDLKEAVKKGDYNNLERNQILEKIYLLDSKIYKVDDAVIEGFDVIFKNSKSTFPIINLSNKVSLYDSMEKEKESINILEIEAKTLIQHFNKNEQELLNYTESTKSLKIIILFLMISFLLTVIYPLHFMPIETNQNPKITFNPNIFLQYIFTLKSFMLLVFFIAIEGIFAYFLFLTNQLEIKLSNAKNSFGKYKDIKAYSEYLD